MMPIIIKDHSWSQSKEKLFIRVPIKGIRADKTSFITSDNYIRLYFPPYYFELFLWGEVDEVQGKCTLLEKECQVVFELPKKLPISSSKEKKVENNIDGGGGGDDGVSGNSRSSTPKKNTASTCSTDWPCLDIGKELTKEQKHEIRARAVESSQKRAKDEIHSALEKRQLQKQMSVQEQIQLDEEARKRITAIKSFETSSFMEELGPEWKAEFDKIKQAEAKLKGETAQHMDEGEDEHHNRKRQEEFLNQVDSRLNDLILQGSESVPTLSQHLSDLLPKKQTKPSSLIWSKDELKNMSKVKSSSSKASESEPPPIRQGGSVVVNFTPREFPTPSRESTAIMEEEWLAKQLEARKNCGFSDENLKPEERDPSWLLEKGLSLLRSESYLGAINAFTSGLKLAPKLPHLLIGRAQAHIAMNNAIKSVEDASQAIELLVPKVVQNVKERIQAHMCRGSGFRKLNMFSEAIGDYREALRLDPDNQQLQVMYASVQQEELNFAKSSDDEES